MVFGILYGNFSVFSYVTSSEVHPPGTGYPTESARKRAATVGFNICMLYEHGRSHRYRNPRTCISASYSLCQPFQSVSHVVTAVLPVGHTCIKPHCVSVADSVGLS